MRRNYSGSSFSIFKLLFAFAIFGLFTGLLDFITSFIVFGAAGSVLVLFVLLIAVAIAAIFGGNKNKAKANLTNDLLKVLNKASIDGNRIPIDDETFLLITTNDEITLNDIDIYMNNEYVGNLSEFSGSYPNAYNSLCSKLIKIYKKKRKSKKQAQEITEPIKEVVIEKDCTYYIKKFHELDSEIEVEAVKTSINETINYLEEIKKIEDEFGESKTKTRKLYEYYLPMYADILANYDRLHDNAPNSDEFKENETKLMKTSSLINSALSSVTSSLMESYYTDLNVNMKTLESILKKDGLVQDQMEAK